MGKLKKKISKGSEKKQEVTSSTKAVGGEPTHENSSKKTAIYTYTYIYKHIKQAKCTFQLVKWCGAAPRFFSPLLRKPVVNLTYSSSIKN